MSAWFKGAESQGSGWLFAALTRLLVPWLEDGANASAGSKSNMAGNGAGGVTMPYAPMPGSGRRPSPRSGFSAEDGEVQRRETQLREVTFTFAVIGLAARLATVDGPVNREEFCAFRKVFPMPEGESNKVRRLFQAACDEKTSVEYHARQVVEMFPARPDLMRELMKRLIAVAVADAPLQPEEQKLLESVAAVLGVSGAQCAQLLDRHAGRRVKGVHIRGKAHAARTRGNAIEELPSNPYRLLGVSVRSPYTEVKKNYRAMILKYHPDRLSERHMPAARMAQAARHAAAVNAAYDHILRQKGWK